MVCEVRDTEAIGQIWGVHYTFIVVRGSRMLPTSKATLAQSVERLTRNEQVVSSILTSGSPPWDGSPPRGFYYRTICLSVSIARVAELVDAQDLGSCVARRVGSSPISRTT